MRASYTQRMSARRRTARFEQPDWATYSVVHDDDTETPASKNPAREKPQPAKSPPPPTSTHQGRTVGIAVVGLAVVVVAVVLIVQHVSPATGDDPGGASPWRPTPSSVATIPSASPPLASGATIGVDTPFTATFQGATMQATVLAMQRFTYGEDGKTAGVGWNYLAAQFRYVCVAGRTCVLPYDNPPVVVDVTGREYTNDADYPVWTTDAFFLPLIHHLINDFPPGEQVTGWMVFRVPDATPVRLRVPIDDDRGTVYVEPPSEAALIPTSPAPR